MSKSKRYAGTIDLFIYPQDDDGARNQMQEIVNTINEKFPDAYAGILDITECPFGHPEQNRLIEPK